jgi:hypothetical protein
VLGDNDPPLLVKLAINAPPTKVRTSAAPFVVGLRALISLVFTKSSQSCSRYAIMYFPETVGDDELVDISFSPNALRSFIEPPFSPSRQGGMISPMNMITPTKLV